MSGDYSRFAFDPLQNYSGVLLQQGRPLTDSDWNDLVAQINRRAQAGTLDTSGQIVVSAATPDAFKITSDGKALLIGPGRLYVDGLLADNHGTGAKKWIATLAEPYGVDPVLYENQPYPPVPPKAPELPKGDPILVYLDVWQREVTQFEDPDLVERALGVDTTTRLQTVWQVKLLGNLAKDLTCSTPLDKLHAWAAATASSAGRLSTALGKFSATDPCLVPPSGGYRGLENQLYRVEIHKDDRLGPATFKWSRDNASVATRVTRLIDPSNIVVESVGKDSVLRFSSGDWIEITDDYQEWSGLPGELRRIALVTDATRTITLENPLTAGLFPTDPQGNLTADRHTRIRRWDQNGKILDKDGNLYTDLSGAGSNGAIIVPTGGLQLQLENGVLVSFGADPVGGNFHVGDYWVFAARTSDPYLEILDKAPPRGIHHHYAKLAVYTPPATVEDCRPRLKDECCTAVVRPGQSIQAAINSLPPVGGCVCLKPGVHTIPKAIEIGRSNVRLAGESAGTIVRTAAPGAVLIIGGPIEGVEISTIVFERLGPVGNFPGMVTVVGARRSAILDCGVRAASPQQSIGIHVADSEEVRVARCRIESVATGLLATGKPSRNLLFEANVLDFGTDTAGTPSVVSGIVVQDITGSCRVEGNLLRGAWSGIVVNDDMTGPPQASASDMIVTHNVVICAPAPAKVTPNAALVGIDVAAHSSIVSQNIVALPSNGSANIGIRATGDDLAVTDNQIVPAVRSQGAGNGLAGIQIGYSAGKTSSLTRGVRVAGNVVDGCPVGIAVIAAADVLIESNMIDVIGDIADTSGSAGIGLATTQNGQVQGNHISGGGTAIGCRGGTMTRVTGNSISDGGYGVAMLLETGPIVSQNRIDSMANWGVTCVGATGRCDIVENRITFCGFATDTGGVGIGAFNVLGELHAEANEVMNTGLSADGKKSAKLAYGISGTLVLEARIDSNLISYSDFTSRPALGEDRALLMSGYIETSTATSVLGFPVQILGNKFVGPGHSALVQLQQRPMPNNVLNRFERVFFNNNYCMHVTSPPPIGAATVKLVGRSATVMGNHIKAAPQKFPSVDFGGMPGPFIGNVANNTTRIATAAFPTPENSFNVIP